MKQTAYIRSLTSEDEKVLEEYKKQKNEKTNTKAFVMAIYDYFQQKKKNRGSGKRDQSFQEQRISIEK